MNLRASRLAKARALIVAGTPADGRVDVLRDLVPVAAAHQARPSAAGDARETAGGLA